MSGPTSTLPMIGTNTADVKFYHLLQTVAHKQLTTEDSSLSP